MTQLGTKENPLRVAIIGAGPTGFYAADFLLKHKNYVIQVDMYDRLPTPFGLVRGGVAPDHQKIKTVTKAFDKTAKHPNFRFFGYVELGKDVVVADLRQHYHQILYTVGASTDRKLGIPGEDLIGSRTATEFVAWYNGHPDYRDYEFNLDSHENVAIVGVGNVAVDVARILCRTQGELNETDIADHAQAALARSSIKNIYMLGRRGPAQAAFTNTEVRELGELLGADTVVLADEAKLDPLSQQELTVSNDRLLNQKVEIIQEFTHKPRTDKPRTLTLRFLVSPVELIGDENGHIKAMRLVKNELYQAERGGLGARATDQFEELPVTLAFRSVGYQGVPLADVPFDAKRGVIANQGGRVIDLESKQPILGEYTAGWIKRGANGIIGTNKPDAVETANAMLADMAEGKVLNPTAPTAAAITAFIAARQPCYFTYDDWSTLDKLEVSKGEAEGRPRYKFTQIADMLAAVGKL